MLEPKICFLASCDKIVPESMGRSKFHHINCQQAHWRARRKVHKKHGCYNYYMIPDWKIELVLKYKHKFPINMWRKDIINEAAKHYTRNGSLENIISSLNNTYFKILKGKINVDRFNEPKGRTDLEVKKV